MFKNKGVIRSETAHVVRKWHRASGNEQKNIGWRIQFRYGCQA
jgi:hypothetical protein